PDRSRGKGAGAVCRECATCPPPPYAGSPCHSCGHGGCGGPGCAAPPAVAVTTPTAPATPAATPPKANEEKPPAQVMHYSKDAGTTATTAVSQTAMKSDAAGGVIPSAPNQPRASTYQPQKVCTTLPVLSPLNFR